jgi:hypothetical protein
VFASFGVQSAVASSHQSPAGHCASRVHPTLVTIVGPMSAVSWVDAIS